MRNRKIRTYPPIIVSAVVILLTIALAAHAVVTEVSRDAAEPQGTVEATNYTVEVAEHAVVVQVPAEHIETPEDEPGQEVADQSDTQRHSFDSDDSQMLMKIAMAEAEGESVNGKAMVMLVVLNRVLSNQFPDSIEEVIFQHYGDVWQFSTVADGGRYWATEPDDECAEALALVESGFDESHGALYFESTGKDGWHSRNLEFLFKLGGHKFYR